MKKKLIILSVIFIIISSFFITYKVSNNIINNKYIIASISNSKLKVIGNIKSNNNISMIKVTAIGNNELIPYNIIYEGINKSNEDIEYKIYKTNKEIKNVKEEKLGEPIETGIIKASNKDNIVLVEDEFITSTNTGFSMYYYIKLESKERINIEGKIKVEESQAKPKINVLAAYVEQEDGSYNKVTDSLPTSGYTINQAKSVCNNGATPIWDYTNKGVIVSNLTKNGTECYLYYDILKGGGQILANIAIEEGSKDGFTDMDTEEHTDENEKSILYSDEDDLGTTYYFRGKVKDNWVKFGKENGQDIWWRIIRINGNGSIRMIYTGTGTTAPTTDGYLNNNTTKSQLNSGSTTTFKYNEYYNDNKYVGYMYGTQKTGSAGNETTPTTSYKDAHANNYDSDIKKQLDDWYSTNLKNEYGQYIDPNAGFCNDRKINTQSKQWWSSDTAMGYGKNATAYAPWSRLLDSSGDANAKHTPTFKCSQTDDTFTLPGAKKPNGEDYGNHKLKANNGSDDSPIGLITIDEAVFAGGYYYRSSNQSDNKQFYLYTGQNYWTMSPFLFNGSFASVFFVNSDGFLDNYPVYNTRGVRPVINLSANVKLSGDGTSGNPYTLKTE